MTPAANNPDLCRIGESAFMEVLGTFLSLKATVREAVKDSHISLGPDSITSDVLLTGQLLSGSVHLQLPRTFVAYAVRLLTGLDGDVGSARELQEDTAGELANLVAGRVAAKLAANGYPCQLDTPSVSRSASVLTKNQDGVTQGRTDLICEGHWLSLEIQCCYADP